MTEFAQDTTKPNLGNPAVPKLLQWLPAAFLLSVVVVGAGLAVTSSGARTFPSDQPVVTGQWMSVYEKGLDAGAPWRDRSVNLWGGANYRLFGEAREGAVIGTDGWLFTSEEFQSAPGDAQEITSKLAYIKQVQTELSKTGAKLMVALIPAKVRVYPGELGTLRVPAINSGRYQQFRQQLEAAGVAAPDLYAAITAAKPQGGLFLRTDTHWTSAGAQTTAQALASVIGGLPLDLPAANYRTTLQPAAKRSGDLMRYIPVPEGTGPLPDMVQEPAYVLIDRGGGGLLSDSTLAVTLVGTSYSAETKQNVWHFGGALSEALGTEILNAAQEGKGPITPMREYLKSQDRTNNPPQLVIWEIPERFLRVEYKETK